MKSYKQGYKDGYAFAKDELRFFLQNPKLWCEHDFIQIGTSDFVPIWECKKCGFDLSTYEKPLSL